MSNNHEEQIRIVQETVAGKEITFAHVMGGGADRISETWSESTGRLSFFCYRNYEYDAAGICCHRIRYRSKKRKHLPWICRSFYRNTHHHRRDFRRHVCPDRSGNLFQRFSGICRLWYYKEIGSVTMTRITKEELLEKIFNDDYEHLKGKNCAWHVFVFPAKKFVWLTSSILPRPLFIRIWDCISVYMRGGSHRRIHWSDPFYPMGSSCRCCGCGNEKRRCRNWIYGSLLRFPHFNRRSVTGTDCGGRSRSIFSWRSGISHLWDP